MTDRLDAPWITAARPLCDILTKAGHQAWFVGGCVRNALIAEPVSDIDITTDAHPDRVVALATAAGLRTVPTGIDHGTVTVISDGIPYEVTTLRRDVDTDGRRATVAFADTIAQDAARRDFTMNALYAEPDGTLADPLGGVADLRARRVRFIGDPATRIAEDYLRILRFFRFHALYGDPAGGIDAEGLAACADGLDGIGRLSAERIGAEMAKLLAAPDPAPAMAAMRSCGALLRVLPGAGTGMLPVLVHVEQAAGLVPDWRRRLAALGGQDVADRLRLSNADARHLDLLREGLGTLTPPAELGYRHDTDVATDILALRAAAFERELDPADVAAARDGADRTFPLAAADLMPALEGPALGAALRRAEADWIASDFTLTRDDLLTPGQGGDTRRGSE